MADIIQDVDLPLRPVFVNMAQHQRIRPSRAELSDDLDAALEAYQSAPAAQLFKGPPSAHFGSSRSASLPTSNASANLQESSKLSGSRPQSKFKQAMAAKRQGLAAAAPSATSGPSSALGFIGEIKERSEDSKHIQAPSLSQEQPSGFPQPAKLTFATPASSDHIEATSSKFSPERDLEQHPYEAMAHQDADQMFAAMTEEEIFQEQQELMKMLSPSTIEFLKNRKSKTSGKSHLSHHLSGDTNNHYDSGTQLRKVNDLKPMKAKTAHCSSLKTFKTYTQSHPPLQPARKMLWRLTRLAASMTLDMPTTTPTTYQLLEP